jgi:uncharacterized protein YdgA (DUF945 family)
VKKSFVFLLLALALVVIVSPGIVGKLAEQSMDENLDWAATESREVTITSQGFDRGWFSSAGQHRIELNHGDIRDALTALFEDSGYTGMPALIIDTRIDHGLVPVTSMGREKGSLAPGLGSAVSTLHLAFENGDRVELPGTIYSKVGLTGELQSNLVVEPGSFSNGPETLRWSAVDARIMMSAASSTVGFEGVIDELALAAPGDELTVGAITFAGEQAATPFGFSVGDANIRVGSIAYPSERGRMTSGPLTITSTASLDDDLVSGRTTLEFEAVPLGELGSSSIGVDIAITDVDAAALGRIADVLNDVDSYDSGDALRLAVEDDLRTLFARGFEARVQRLDIAMPPGTVSATLDMTVAPTDIDDFVMTALLLAVDARLDLSLPDALYDYALTIEPQIGAVVAMGFLRWEDNAYRMQAEFRNGLLTVNGAPMPGLIPGLQ